MRILIIIFTACIVFTSCGIKNDPEYKSQESYNKTINLI